MDIKDLKNALSDDKETKELFSKIESYNTYNEEEQINILLSISFMIEGSFKNAKNLLKPIYESHKERAEALYWYASALIGDAESVDEMAEAKGIMLDAIKAGLEKAMEEDAIFKLSYAEAMIDQSLS